tara:strand:- start:227 stop:469 length:243 start_codon:yes stop_codon:yes gene_type:complete
MYKYDCPTWYWNYSGVRNLYTDDDIDESKAREIALEKEKEYSGSSFCNIYMLQQFECSIKSVKNFKGMASIPSSVELGNK